MTCSFSKLSFLSAAWIEATLRRLQPRGYRSLKFQGAWSGRRFVIVSIRPTYRTVQSAEHDLQQLVLMLPADADIHSVYDEVKTFGVHVELMFYSLSRCLEDAGSVMDGRRHSAPGGSNVALCGHAGPWFNPWTSNLGLYELAPCPRCDALINKFPALHDMLLRSPARDGAFPD